MAVLRVLLGLTHVEAHKPLPHRCMCAEDCDILVRFWWSQDTLSG